MTILPLKILFGVNFRLSESLQNYTNLVEDGFSLLRVDKCFPGTLFLLYSPLLAACTHCPVILWGCKPTWQAGIAAKIFLKLIIASNQTGFLVAYALKSAIRGVCNMQYRVPGNQNMIFFRSGLQ